MQYSKFRPAEPVEEALPTPPSDVWVTWPALVVGFALTAALCVLLLLTQSQLSQVSFELTAMERQLDALEIENEKLQVAHARAYSLEALECAALELGMVRPAPGQYREIDIEPK